MFEYTVSEPDYNLNDWRDLVNYLRGMRYIRLVAKRLADTIDKEILESLSEL